MGVLMEIEQRDALGKLLATCRLYKPGDVVEIPRSLGDRLKRAGFVLVDLTASIVVTALAVPFVIVLGGAYLVLMDLRGERIDFGRLWQR
jgi:hypothetical protein